MLKQLWTNKITRLCCIIAMGILVPVAFTPIFIVSLGLF